MTKILLTVALILAALLLPGDILAMPVVYKQNSALKQPLHALQLDIDVREQKYCSNEKMYLKLTSRFTNRSQSTLIVLRGSSVYSYTAARKQR